MRPRNMLSLLSCGLAAAAFAAGFANCGGSELSDDLLPPCDGVFANQCGTPCSAASPCPTGLYCGADGTCTADCGAGAKPCPAGQACTADGRCTGSPIDGGFLDSSVLDGANQQDGIGGDACGEVSVTTEPVVPTVMLLVDQSGSMSEAFGGAMNRWEAAYHALANPSTGVVAQLEDSVRFGLTLYTSHNGFQNGGTCPELIKVPIALNNHSAIDSVFAAENPEDDTPTGESIRAVVPDVLAVHEPGPKIIVLATDGEPDSCDVPDPQTPEARGLSIKAAQDAHAAGVDLFVISVGDQVGQDHLQEMANVGVGLPANAANRAPYYVANNPTQLRTAFQQIISGVIGCVFTLQGQVQPGMENQGTVLLDGQPLQLNDPNGWRLNNPSEIELRGTSCDSLTDGGQHSLVVKFPCAAVVLPPPR